MYQDIGYYRKKCYQAQDLKGKRIDDDVDVCRGRFAFAFLLAKNDV